MRSQHENLVRTIDSYLRRKEKKDGQQGNERYQRQGQRWDERARQTGAEQVPCALVIAGFHTGRSVVADFLEVATGSSSGPSANPDAKIDTTPNTGEIPAIEARAEQPHSESTDTMEPPLRAAELFEVDVDCNVRPWLPERAGETKDATKRWCVVAVLVRR